MKPRTVIILVVVVFFLLAVGLALVREVDREQAKLELSISGVVEVSNAMLTTGQADIVRTDRLVLLLIDPRTGEAVALKTVSPFVPPQAVAIGQEDARLGTELEGSYYLMGITDKDGDIAQPTRGEVFGRSPEAIALGKEQVRLLLDQPFRGQVPPLVPESPARYPQTGRETQRTGDSGWWPLLAANDDPRAMESGGTTIEGRIEASRELARRSAPDGRLVIRMLVAGEPTMTRAAVHSRFSFPQRFRAGFANNVSGEGARMDYAVNAVTCSVGAVGASAGETLLARIAEPVPQRTSGIAPGSLPAAN